MTGIFYVLLSTAVIQGWNRYQNKSQRRKLFLENKTLEPEIFQSRIDHYTTELSLLPYVNPQKYHVMSRLIHSSFSGAMI